MSTGTNILLNNTSDGNNGGSCDSNSHVGFDAAVVNIYWLFKTMMVMMVITVVVVLITNITLMLTLSS